MVNVNWTSVLLDKIYTYCRLVYLYNKVRITIFKSLYSFYKTNLFFGPVCAIVQMRATILYNIHSPKSTSVHQSFIAIELTTHLIRASLPLN